MILWELAVLIATNLSLHLVLSADKARKYMFLCVFLYPSTYNYMKNHYIYTKPEIAI